MRKSTPLVLPFAALAGGVLLARAVSFSPLEVAVPLLGFIAVSFAAALRKIRWAKWAAGLLALAASGAGLWLISQRGPSPKLSVPDGETAILEGCVVEPGLTAADREKFVLELAPDARVQVSLFVKEDREFPRLPYGSRIEFLGKLRSPHNYNNPGSFDFKHYLARQRIFWNASGNADTVKILPGRCGDWVHRPLFALRMAALDRLDRLYANDAYSNGMMQAVLIGATAKLERIWTEDYRSTGTFHALVISGGHVAVLAAVLLFFLRLCGVSRGASTLAAIALAWLYSGVTGWQAPVVRSAAGMTLFGIGRIFYRDGRLLNVLAAVAIFFLLLDPEQVLDASFQLSFLAVALIGAFVVPALDATSGPLSEGLAEIEDKKRDMRLAPRTAQFRVEMRLLIRTLNLYGLPSAAARWFIVGSARILLFFWELSLTSMVIQTGLALAMIAYFHQVAFSGVTANAIVVPLLSAVVPLGFLAIACNSIWIAKLCAALLGMAKWTVGLHARWEPDLRIPAPPLWLALVFAAALILSAVSRSRWHRILTCASALAALAAIAIHPFRPAVEPGMFELDAIDVGQGDSLLAAFPGGSLMLIDAGGIPTFNRKRKPGIDVGEDVVSNYLWTRSIKHIDVMVMTHAHEDHMGGMASVIRNFRPRELWVGATPGSPEWDGVRTAAEKYGVAIRHMQGRRKFSYSGTAVEIVAPYADYQPALSPKNNDSLVMRISYGKTSFLLTGDMEKQIEQDLLADGFLEKSTVLKVGHHGSRTSSTPGFLDAVHPAFGIISAGFENSYGHPHQATLDALTERKVAVFRTDQRGLIRVLSDGARMTLE